MRNWWRDVTREGALQGFHTGLVVSGLRWGIILFITSEILFFFAFFWAFFHSSLSPSLEIGCSWPPSAIWPINPFSIPLLNTLLLLSSGVRVTWAHHALMCGCKMATRRGLVVTIVLGGYFTILQAAEYSTAPFSLADSVYGRTFFVTTGFHGTHVLIGTTLLIICLLRTTKYQFSKQHHFGFEARAWYWHFVDVVWIFLYVFMYWWGA